MRPRTAVLLAVAVAAVALPLAAIDTVLERPAFADWAIVIEAFEWTVIIGAAVAAVSLALTLRSVRADQTVMRDDLARAVEQGADWRARHGAALEDLSDAIRRQFDAWSLTPAEADIAGLMLKGVALRDIARLRRTSETTIRQQAQGIYRKSGLSGRAELAAYFLESLFEERWRPSGAAPAASGEGR